MSEIGHLMDYKHPNSREGQYNTVCGLTLDGAATILHSANSSFYRNRTLCKDCEYKLRKFAGLRIDKAGELERKASILSAKIDHMEQKANELDVCLEPTIGRPRHCGDINCYKRHE